MHSTICIVLLGEFVSRDAWLQQAQGEIKSRCCSHEQKERCERRRGPGWEPGALGSSSSCTPYSPGQVPRPIPQFPHLRTEYGSKTGTILAQGLSHKGQSADMSECGPFPLVSGCSPFSMKLWCGGHRAGQPGFQSWLSTV